MAEGGGRARLPGRVQNSRDIVQKRVYAKEHTVIVDVGDIYNVSAKDVITAVEGMTGIASVFACVPRQRNCYELTVANADVVRIIEHGLQCNNKEYQVSKVVNDYIMVSFLHLPAYVTDDDIRAILSVYDIEVVSDIFRRCHSNINVTDGTRYMRCKFPPSIKSLPYSMKFDTVNGKEFFRVIHNDQVRVCKVCMSDEHIARDCPNVECYRCHGRGHLSFQCKTRLCPDCHLSEQRCQCYTSDHDEEAVNDQVSDEIGDHQEGASAKVGDNNEDVMIIDNNEPVAELDNERVAEDKGHEMDELDLADHDDSCGDVSEMDESGENNNTSDSGSDRDDSNSGGSVPPKASNKQNKKRKRKQKKRNKPDKRLNDSVLDNGEKCSNNVDVCQNVSQVSDTVAVLNNNQSVVAGGADGVDTDNPIVPMAQSVCCPTSDPQVEGSRPDADTAKSNKVTKENNMINNDPENVDVTNNTPAELNITPIPLSGASVPASDIVPRAFVANFNKNKGRGKSLKNPCNESFY
jgi:hypothetical protein